MFTPGWIPTLLEQDDIHGGTFIEDNVTLQLPPNTFDEEVLDGEHEEREELYNDEFCKGEDLSDEEVDDPPSELETHLALGQMAPIDKEKRARRMVARLGLPFGVPLFTLVQIGQCRAGYKRVAVEFTVRF